MKTRQLVFILILVLVGIGGIKNYTDELKDSSRDHNTDLINDLIGPIILVIVVYLIINKIKTKKEKLALQHN